MYRRLIPTSYVFNGQHSSMKTNRFSATAKNRQMLRASRTEAHARNVDLLNDHINTRYRVMKDVCDCVTDRNIENDHLCNVRCVAHIIGMNKLIRLKLKWMEEDYSP